MTKSKKVGGANTCKKKYHTSLSVKHLAQLSDVKWAVNKRFQRFSFQSQYFNVKSQFSINIVRLNVVALPNRVQPLPLNFKYTGHMILYTHCSVDIVLYFHLTHDCTLAKHYVLSFNRTIVVIWINFEYPSVRRNCWCHDILMFTPQAWHDKCNDECLVSLFWRYCAFPSSILKVMCFRIDCCQKERYERIITEFLNSINAIKKSFT